MPHRGYILLYRRSIDSGLLQHAKPWQFLCWCLLTATHKPYKRMFNGMIFELEPGELVTSREEACRFLGLTPKEYRGIIQTLENTGFLTSKRASKGTVFSIVNWHRYQVTGPAEGPAKGRDRASRPHCI